MNNTYSAEERVALIEEAREALANLPSVRSFATMGSAELPIDTDTLNAAIMGTGIGGFDDSMSPRSRRIVKNTYNYADTVSLLKFPDPKQMEQRYNEFMKQMRAVGWTVFSSPLTQYKATTQKLTMDNVVLKLINTAVAAAVTEGATALKVLSGVAEAAMEGLKDEPAALELFERNSKKSGGGNFCISSSMEDKYGDINMAVAAIAYTCWGVPTKVLFWEWSASEVSIYKSMGKMTINDEDYQMTEDLVLKTIKEYRNYIVTLEYNAAKKRGIEAGDA
jgi:hypothetical protein